MSEKNIKVLIADDDEAIVDATGIMLEALGYNIAQVTDASEIIKKVETEQPDLLLLDIWMSGIDGRDVCQKLKKDSNIRHIPVLMVSASRQIKESALSCGADDFLAKPFEMTDLIEKIQKLVNKQPNPSI